METDSKNGGLIPIGFIVLNLNTLLNTIVYDLVRNNHHNGGYTVVPTRQKTQQYQT